MSYAVRISEGGRVTKRRVGSLDEALELIEGTLRPVAAQIDRAPARALLREIEPRDQVAARGELSGPRRLRAGVDVRGDGSTLAFTGRISRRPIAPEEREDGFQALRRTLTGNRGPSELP